MSRVLVIGGGAIGLSVAYHLARLGQNDVTVLERNKLTSGTSWHAAGIVGPLRATPNMTTLAAEALTCFPELEIETGLSTGFQNTGGYWLARHTDRLDELHRIADLGVTQGLTPRMLPPDEVQIPLVHNDGLVGALHVPEDGNVNPVDLCMAYARGARMRGVTIQEGVGVEHLVREGNRITGVALQDGGSLEADIVVLCTGAWSRELAQSVHVALPLQAVEHMYVVTEPITGLSNPFPVIRDLDRGIYIKGDAGKLVIGGFEPYAKTWDAYGPEGDRAFLELEEDWDQFAPFMQAALDLIPALKTVGIQHFMNGPESFTHDTRPLVGRAPGVDGLFVAAGMNSVGVMTSAGIGKSLAHWIVHDEPPFEAWEIDIARADPKAATPNHMEARMEEAVADLFALHWPYKQPKSGRGLRCSALHDRWASAGAVFGQTAGWERGLWYVQDERERVLHLSTGTQSWWPIAAREAAMMQNGAALLDLSPFTKIDVEGPGAVDALNAVTTAQMDMPQGRAVYTQMLNRHGGIELDVTITRLNATRFHLISGAATRMRDLDWLRRHLPGCNISDVTEHYCTIGVMGGGTAEILDRILPQNSWSGVGLGTVREHIFEGAPLRAMRMSFVGEYGWEMTLRAQDAHLLFDRLIANGATAMGHYALDGCRVEKGFKHWGHDIGATITPLEAGLGFTIDWTKEFAGKEALVHQKSHGLHRKLVLFRVDQEVLLLHDEPIYANGRHVGYTTSGARGPRTGLNLAFGLITAPAGVSLEHVLQMDFQIKVAGRMYQAAQLKKPPFDPSGKRMKS